MHRASGLSDVSMQLFELNWITYWRSSIEIRVRERMGGKWPWSSWCPVHPKPSHVGGKFSLHDS